MVEQQVSLEILAGVMHSRDSSHELCDKFLLIGIMGVKSFHPVKVGAGKAFHVLWFSAIITFCP